MKKAGDYQQQKKVRNLIRLSLVVIIAPVLYLGLWIFISADESLLYTEKVQQLMSYFPLAIRNPLGISIAFFGMSIISAVLGFYAFLNTKSKKVQLFSLLIAGGAIIMSLLYGFTLL